MKDPFTFFYIAHEAEDLPGQWIAHCLDLDIVTQGESFRDAITSVREAVEIALEDAGPAGYKRAPQEFFDVFTHVMEEGERLEFDKIYSADSDDDGLSGMLIAGVLNLLPAEATKKPKRAVRGPRISRKVSCSLVLGPKRFASYKQR